jgi:hypothetical protein
MYKEREGDCLAPVDHKENGFRLGQWIRVQRRNADTMSTSRRERLDELGFGWDPPHEAGWAEGFRYLTIYKEREGHCRVPSSHEEDGYRLGQWVSVQRQKSVRMSQDRKERLNGLGFVWDPFEADWEEGFKRLQAYVKEHKHCRVPRQYKTPDGYNLGQWVSNRRARSSIVPPERKAQLAALGFKWKVVDPAESY